MSTNKETIKQKFLEIHSWNISVMYNGLIESIYALYICHLMTRRSKYICCPLIVIYNTFDKIKQILGDFLYFFYPLVWWYKYIFDIQASKHQSLKCSKTEIKNTVFFSLQHSLWWRMPFYIILSIMYIYLPYFRISSFMHLYEKFVWM